MSVIQRAAVQPRMWRGFDDPGLPVGVYISLGLGIGDVSGGTLLIEHQFKQANDPASTRLYNIEQLSAFSTDNTPAPGFLVAVGFEQLPTANVTVQRWQFALLDDGGGFGTMPFTALRGFPIFIGQSTPNFDTLAAVNVGIANPGAGIVFQSVIQGFIWEPRAAQSEGGLRRPNERLYGR